MNNLNWPTAFVITAIIFAGTFVYNKPIGAALGARDGMIALNMAGTVWQLRDGKVRICQIVESSAPVGDMICSSWTED